MSSLLLGTPCRRHLALLGLVTVTQGIHVSSTAAQPWRLETVSGGYGLWTSIAVTPDGTPRIVWATANSVRTDEYPWGVASTVASEGPDLIVMDLAPNGNPSYTWLNRNTTPIDDTIRVLSPNGGLYPGLCSSMPSLKMDGNGVLHLIYAYDAFCDRQGSLRYLTKAPGEDWVAYSSGINTLWYDYRGRVMALDLGAGDDAAAVFVSGLEGFLNLRYKDDIEMTGGGSGEIIADANDGIEHVALVIDDTTDQPHVIYNDIAAGELIYATRVGGSWTTDIIARTDGDSWWYGSIVLDGGGTPHVAFFNEETGTVRYARLSGSVWVQQTLETVGAAGGYTSLAIDAYDDLHMSYYDANGTRVRYASSRDCNDNNTHDWDEIDAGLLDDCNGNGHPDQCEIDLGFAGDCDGDGVPDECETDCNNDGIPDDCGGVQDCNGNSIPDSCEPDCNGNGRPDDCDIADGFYLDCNGNGVLDVCEPPIVSDPQYQETHVTNVPDLRESWSSFGDFDEDGDMDLVRLGVRNINPPVISRIFLREPSFYHEINAAGLWTVSNGVAEWGDYDNDGDLDLFKGGHTGSSYIFHIYENTGITCTPIEPNCFLLFDAMPDVDFPRVAEWVDYDTDGDLDILFVGSVLKFFRNDGSEFVNVGDLGVTGMSVASADIGDYDADGDLDLFLTGSRARIYRNDDGMFVFDDFGFPNVGGGTWGDADADGDLDVFLLGTSGFLSADARYFRNETGTYVDLQATGLRQLAAAKSQFGDYDNDGDLDLLYWGQQPGGVSDWYAGIFRNEGGGAAFTDIDMGFQELRDVFITWADQDDDGDLDVLMSGEWNSASHSHLYESVCGTRNTRPLPPTNLSMVVDSTSHTFMWDPGSDAETPSPGLTYNLRVGTAPGASDILSAMSNETTGFRQVPRPGNTSHTRSWTLDVPDGGPVFWAVQSVDGQFIGSEWATSATEPVCSVTPRSIAFGHVSGHADSTFTIRNTGGGALMGEVTSTCADFVVLSGGGPFMLGPSETLEVGVRFTPSSIGEHACAIDLGVASCSARAYVGDVGGGMKIFDVVDPTAPQLVATYPEQTMEIDVVDGLVYHTGLTGSFRVVGAFDPTQPYEVGDIIVPSETRDVQVVGSIAYVATSATGSLHIVDVEQPTSPALRGTYDSPVYVSRLDVSGSYAYLATDQGLEVVEADDLADPDLDGLFSTAAPAWGVDVVGDLAYVACSSAGLQVLDVSSPTPTFVSSVAVPGLADDVLVENDRAYVAAGDSGLVIVDVSDPALPAIVGRHQTADFAISVDVFAGYAYVAARNAGIEIVDVHDVTTPALVATYDTDGVARSIHVVGGVEVTGYGDAVIAVPNTDAPAPSVPVVMYPNPFRTTVTLRFDVESAEELSIGVYDIAGRRVRSLLRDRRTVGTHSLVWNGRDDGGRRVRPGVYFVALREGSRSVVRKLLRIE